MRRRAKPKVDKNGNYIKNGQAAKRGLNRSMSDAAWGELISKLEYTAGKQGKRVYRVNPKHTSQQCSVCNHIDASNRNGEKFVCTNCGHIDDANLQAARNIKQRGVEQYGLVLKTKPKLKKVWQDLPEPKQLCLFEMPTDEVTSGKRRYYRGTRKSKCQEPGNQIEVQQLTLFNMDMLDSSYSIRQNPLTSS